MVRVDALAFGTAGLKGWRSKVAEAVAGPLSKRSPLSHEQIRAAAGAVFFAVSLVYVGGTIRRMLAER